MRGADDRKADRGQWRESDRGRGEERVREYNRGRQGEEARPDE